MRYLEGSGDQTTAAWVSIPYSGHYDGHFLECGYSRTFLATPEDEFVQEADSSRRQEEGGGIGERGYWRRRRKEP